MTLVLALSLQPGDVFWIPEDLEMSFRFGLCVYKQEVFIRSILSFFAAHLNCLQAFLLSCPSTAIVGQLSKLQVRFWFSCNKKHHPHKLWQMPGDALTNCFAGAPSEGSTSHVGSPEEHGADDIPFHVSWRKGTYFQWALYYVYLEGTAALRTIFWGFIHLQQVSLSLLEGHRGNLQGECHKKEFWLIICYTHKDLGQGLYETSACLPHSWDLLIPHVSAMGCAEPTEQ